MIELVPMQCPFCGEAFEAGVDPEYGDSDYIEDCPVCCRAIELRLRLDPDGGISLRACRDD